MALENFKDLLSGYNELKARPLNHGDLKAKADDGRAFRNERLACIGAVTDFYGIFSAMLTALSLHYWGLLGIAGLAVAGCGYPALWRQRRSACSQG